MFYIKPVRDLIDRCKAKVARRVILFAEVHAVQNPATPKALLWGWGAELALENLRATCILFEKWIQAVGGCPIQHSECICNIHLLRELAAFKHGVHSFQLGQAMAACSMPAK